MVSLINKQLLLTAYAYLYIMEQQKAQQGSDAIQLQADPNAAAQAMAKEQQLTLFSLKIKEIVGRGVGDPKNNSEELAETVAGGGYNDLRDFQEKVGIEKVFSTAMQNLATNDVDGRLRAVRLLQYGGNSEQVELLDRYGEKNVFLSREIAKCDENIRDDTEGTSKCDKSPPTPISKWEDWKWCLEAELDYLSSDLKESIGALIELAAKDGDDSECWYPKDIRRFAQSLNDKYIQLQTQKTNGAIGAEVAFPGELEAQKQAEAAAAKAAVKIKIRDVGKTKEKIDNMLKEKVPPKAFQRLCTALGDEKVRKALAKNNLEPAHNLMDWFAGQADKKLVLQILDVEKNFKEHPLLSRYEHPEKRREKGVHEKEGGASTSTLWPGLAEASNTLHEQWENASDTTETRKLLTDMTALETILETSDDKEFDWRNDKKVNWRNDGNVGHSREVCREFSKCETPQKRDDFIVHAAVLEAFDERMRKVGLVDDRDEAYSRSFPFYAEDRKSPSKQAGRLLKRIKRADHILCEPLIELERILQSAPYTIAEQKTIRGAFWEKCEHAKRGDDRKNRANMFVADARAKVAKRGVEEFKATMDVKFAAEREKIVHARHKNVKSELLVFDMKNDRVIDLLVKANSVPELESLLNKELSKKASEKSLGLTTDWINELLADAKAAAGTAKPGVVSRSRLPLWYQGEQEDDPFKRNQDDRSNVQECGGYQE